MASFAGRLLIFADGGFSIHIGNNVWHLDTRFLTYLLIAAFVGVIAEFIIGWRLPAGLLGATLAGVLGIWLMTQVIIVSGPGDVYLKEVPLVRALVGAALLVAIWHGLTYRSWRGRHRYYRRS
ncbi:MAG TPA: hypothetical protein VGF67_26915 [Ktedonobacteraceae bacterium]|jgi:uncharacterized membrane protein YeaQ/YmgE (transglycosylase-associated protein family)